MGRLLRFLKLTAFIASSFSAVLFFSAFNESPEVQMGLGEGIQKSIINQIEKGQSLTFKLMNAVKGLPEDDKERTEWFHQKVEDQKKQDYAANERRENSYIYHHNGKRWVFIQGKYYEYNPRNVYVVNGVKTFYEPPQSNKKLTTVNHPMNSQRVTATKVVREHSVSSKIPDPVTVYTKAGMTQLKQNLNQIQLQMEQRNKALKQLDKGN